MKNIFGLLLVAIFSLGCEDVVEVDVPQTSPRLSIDGLVRLDTSREMTTVTIKASLTSSFFNEINPAELTTISITNPDYEGASQLDPQVLTLNEINPGIYEAQKSTAF